MDRTLFPSMTLYGLVAAVGVFALPLTVVVIADSKGRSAVLWLLCDSAILPVTLVHIVVEPHRSRRTGHRPLQKS